MSKELLDLACGVVVTGFDGTSLDAELADFFAKHAFAGYILFARNAGTPQRVRALTDRLRDIGSRAAAPIVAIDQEGGRVARLREDVESLPPMMTLGATGDETLARQAGAQSAFDLRRCGINVDFAPVADVAVDPCNTVIGSRSFGSVPSAVAALARAFAEGLESGGVVPTIKHFPGHGSTRQDSHLEIPRIDVDAPTFRSRDLAPFADLAAGARAFMSAHVVVEAIDPSRPATLSPTFLTQILRGELGFAGCCFTDCMQMDAIARSIGTVEGVVAAISAGADAALVSHDPRLALRAATGIAQAVRDGELPLSRLEEAYERVERLRQHLQEPIPLSLAPPAPGIGRTIARRGMTLVRGSVSTRPQGAIVVSFDAETYDGAASTGLRRSSLPEAHPELAQIDCSLEPAPEDVERAIAQIRMRSLLPIVLMRRAHLYDRQAVAVRRIAQAFPDAIVVSVREPFDLACVPEAANLLAAYGDDAASFAGLADVLFNGAPPEGRLPVNDRR